MGVSPGELRDRLRLDFEACRAISGEVIEIEAYRNADDLEHRRNQIASATEAHLATHYRVRFHVPTLVGPGQIQDVTEIGFNLSVKDYPDQEPATWVVSDRVPYSPHFMKGAPVCIGEIWQRASGELLLADLMIHIAKLLNWDEIPRGSGYRGWNGEAIDYHARHYKGRPISPELRYPAIPPALLNDQVSDDDFEPLRPSNDDFEPLGSSTPAGAADWDFAPGRGEAREELFV